MTTDQHDVFLVPQQFPTIREAIDAILRPSTIMVSPGVYAEDLVLVDTPEVVITTTHFLRRGVVLVGAAAESVVHIENSSVYLAGLEIRSKGRARGIAAVNSAIALQECVLAGNKVNSAEASGGAMSCVGSSVRVQKSIIAGNSTESSHATGGGLYLFDCKVEIAGSSIQANEINGRSRGSGAGIYCERSRMRLWRSRVTDNGLFSRLGEGAGLYLKQSSAQIGGSVITGNGVIDGQGGGIFISGSAEDVVVHKNTVLSRNFPDDLVIG
jgi:nitrous oxidase accessory protein NosD